MSKKFKNINLATNLENKKRTSPVIGKSRKFFFTILLILIPVFLLGLVEAGLRVFGYGEDLRLFITASEDLPQFLRANPKVGKRFFFMQSTLPSPQKDLFLKQKPANGYRIFVLGESTTAGFPYGNNVMFPRILQMRLVEAFPDRTIEVVNLGMSAISSYAPLDFTDEVLAQKPDAILIYMGHNEYVGAMAVASMESIAKNRSVVLALLRLERFKLFLLLRDAIGAIRVAAIKRGMSEAEQNRTVTLMERIISDKDIPYGSPIYEKGKRQFEANLRAIVSKAARAGVPVVLSDLVCNVRDQKPFSSIETDSAGSANRAFRAARALESRKRYKEAHAEYLRAKDLDAIRFRASEEFDAVILRTAEAFNAPVVPMKKLFENAAPNGLVGDALMTDHLHPNVNGYFLMADGFFQTLRNNAFIAATWDSTRIRPVAALRRDWGFTELDSMVADLGIRFLKGGWPFQPKTAVNTALSDFRPFTAAESLAVVIAGSTGDSETLEIGHVRLARRYMAEGRWESAFREYRALYTAIPYETMFYQGAVEALFKKGDRARALECLRLSRRFLDTNFANRWIGLIYLEQGNPSEAIPYLERARARVGSDTQVLQALQKAYAETGEPSKSEAAAGALRSMPPPDRAVPRRTAEDATPPADPVRIALERAQRLVQAGELERALALIEGTLSVRETFQARNWIGQIYLQQKRYSQAIPQLERARALNPEDPGVLYNLSLVYLLTGNTGRSSEILGELEAAAPGFQGIERIRSEIHRRTGS